MRVFYALLLSLGVFVSSSSLAQDWPNRTVRIIVPFGAGGTGDLLGRMVADHLSTVYKQQFIVENRTGAGGMLGAKAGSSAEPDGYTLTITNVTTMSLIPAINPKTPYDAMKDFTHIAYLAGGPIVLAVFPGTGAKTVKEFINYAESGGKPITFGSIGVGSDGHIVGEAIGRALGIKVQHLPYRGGSPPALADVIAGHITYLPMTIAQTSALVKDGKLNGLAITAPERMRQLPDVPTFKELGYPNLVSLTWFSVSGPANLPRNTAEALHRHIADMLKKPESMAKFDQIGLMTQPMSFDEVSRFVAAEGARWKPLIEAAGLVGKAE